MKSITMRNNPLFMRNSFPGIGKWGIPSLKKQTIDLQDIRLIACSDIKRNDNDTNRQCGVHHFVDDYRFDGTYYRPEKHLEKYAQYRFVLTPDFSLYAEMDMWLQLANVAKNRWVGAYWQSKGLSVIPTISWSTSASFDFCFDGVEQNAIVAVGMIGCKKNRSGFMRGYVAMLEKLKPATIICFGDPFPEMEGNIIAVDYRASRKVVR